jgi:ABC-type polysaccharide/polyol phosphate export permease
MDTVVIYGSAIFGILWIIASIAIMIISTQGVNDARLKGEYRGMSFSLTFLGAFCMWLMWISVYMHQKNPLIQPIIKEPVPKV